MRTDEIDPKQLAKEYRMGDSMTLLARKYGTYPMTISRILTANGVKLRHDRREKGAILIKDGDKLLAYAKSLGRPVTKAELATYLGVSRISPIYFEMWPELGQYLKPSNIVVTEKLQTLYDWLRANEVLYIAQDKRALSGKPVQASLYREYEGVAIAVYDKPKHISKSVYDFQCGEKSIIAKQNGINLIWLHDEDFPKLDKLKKELDKHLAARREKLKGTVKVIED